jgi:hypothetical protein
MSKIEKKQPKEQILLPEHEILTADEFFLMLVTIGLNKTEFFAQAGMSKTTAYRAYEQKKAIPKKYHTVIIRLLGGEERYVQLLDSIRRPQTYWLVAVRYAGSVEFLNYKKLFTNEFEARFVAEECAKEPGATVICKAFEAGFFASGD